MSDSKVKTILVYGDSNTWGYVPHESIRATRARYPYDKRWCGVMALKLGSLYQVIEAGLCGRNTSVDDFFFDNNIDLNGLRTFATIFESANPVDILIIMLGTNDLLDRVNLPLDKSASAIKKMIKKAREYNLKPFKTIVIAPPPISEGKNFAVNILYGERAGDSYHFYEALKSALDGMEDVILVDAREVIAKADGVDGIHLSEASHQKLGQFIYEVVKKIE